ncbi:hypothetical protein Tco_0506058 [Tanacetum coccineum]
MSQPANPAHTPANFAVWNTTGKGSKQTPDNNSGCLPADNLQEICEKHYNQILPIMAEKVHQEKLQGLQTCLTYGESSHRNSQIQFSESESCDRKKRPKKRRESHVTASRGTRPSQTASVFSRLRQESGKLTEEAQRSTGRSAETPSQRRKDARELIRSYITCSRKRQQEIEDPVEIHHIKQREGESTEAFMERFKAESMHVSGAPEFMKISVFMYGITNPDLIKKLNDNIPKYVDEMMNVTITFLRGEVAAANQSKKKVPPAWKHHETSHRPYFDKRLDFKNQHKSNRQQDHFTPLTKTPKEILAVDTVKFKALPPMTGPVENRNKKKFCEFNGDKGHNTDECIHLKRKIGRTTVALGQRNKARRKTRRARESYKERGSS